MVLLQQPLLQNFKRRDVHTRVRQDADLRRAEVRVRLSVGRTAAAGNLSAKLVCTSQEHDGHVRAPCLDMATRAPPARDLFTSQGMHITIRF